MSAVQNKKIALQVYELLNAGDAEAIGDLLTAEYLEHDPLPGQGTGRDGAVERFLMISRGLAPRFTVEEVIAEDDKVVVRWTNTGTHVGNFAGVPPTGRPFSIGGIDIYRVNGDLLCEHWHQIDQLAMLGQLGLLPEPAAP